MNHEFYFSFIQTGSTLCPIIDNCYSLSWVNIWNHDHTVNWIIVRRYMLSSLYIPCWPIIKFSLLQFKPIRICIEYLIILNLIKGKISYNFLANSIFIYRNWLHKWFYFHYVIIVWVSVIESNLSIYMGTVNLQNSY